ncbi:MAG: hypothetical protein EYC62_01830 [Alphaproteobacteria bacterium]|nr:MAG: hypothetical protein EYC62_01830 [Alphaproteobacteria bacterium]
MHGNTTEFIDSTQHIWRPQERGLTALWQDVLDRLDRKTTGRVDCENECVLLYEMCYRMPHSMPEHLYSDLIRFEDRIRRSMPPGNADTLQEIIIGLAERHPEQLDGPAVHYVVKCLIDTIHERWQSHRPEITLDIRRLANAALTAVARCSDQSLRSAIRSNQTVFQEFAYHPYSMAITTDRICGMMGMKSQERSVFSPATLERSFSILADQTAKLRQHGFTGQIIENIMQAIDSIDIAFRLMPHLATEKNIEALHTVEKAIKIRGNGPTDITNAIAAVTLAALERDPRRINPESLKYLALYYATDPDNPQKPDNFFLKDADRIENTLAAAMIYGNPASTAELALQMAEKIKHIVDAEKIRPSRQNCMALRFAVINMAVLAHPDAPVNQGQSLYEALAADTQLHEAFEMLDPGVVRTLEVDLNRLKDVFSTPVRPVVIGGRHRTPPTIPHPGRHRFPART